MKVKNIVISREETSNLRNFIFKNRKSLDVTVNNLLLALGFKTKLIGTTYLKEAIKYRYRFGSSSKVYFSGMVYPDVAEKYNATSKQVDRDIRTAIHNCYNANNIFKLNFIAGYDIISDAYPPTNSEFIMGAVGWLESELDYSV